MHPIKFELKFPDLHFYDLSYGKSKKSKRKFWRKLFIKVKEMCDD